MRRAVIGVVAPSNKLPRIEFNLGLEMIRQAGFALRVHPQCRKAEFLFAGRDEERARAFFEYASDPELAAVWCARGGYGAARLLPWLDRLSKSEGKPPRKLLLGYSDATALMEYARARWGWATLHSPMPAMRRFCLQTEREWGSLCSFIRGERPGALPWQEERLRFLGRVPRGPVVGELIGGNLTVWNSLLGTPYAGRCRGKILFFEDVDESLYRIDRMIQQLRMAAGLDGVKAIVLGNFLNCLDQSAKVLAVAPRTQRERSRLLSSPKPGELRPLRKTLGAYAVIRRIFNDAAEDLGIPVAWGLPVGHGPGIASLPLGAGYRLHPNGALSLLDWDWLNQGKS